MNQRTARRFFGLLPAREPPAPAADEGPDQPMDWPPEPRQAVVAPPAAGQTDEMRALVAQMAGEFIASTALSRVQSDVQTLARGFTEFKDNIAALNVALGDFRDKQVDPIKRELQFLRYNLGDKVNQTTTNMDVMVAQLDKQIWGLLRAQGMTDEQIRAFRNERGMNPDAPTGRELEAAIFDHQALVDQVETLTQQNKRLIAELERLQKQRKRSRKAK